MAAFFSSITAIFMIAPILFFIIVFSIVKLITKKQRTARNAAINMTTFVLILSVHFLVMAIWGKSMIWLILVVLLFVAIIFSFMFWKIKEEMIYNKMLIGYIRLNFLLFSGIYFLLFCYGIISRGISAVLPT